MQLATSLFIITEGCIWILTWNARYARQLPSSESFGKPKKGSKIRLSHNWQGVEIKMIRDWTPCRRNPLPTLLFSDQNGQCLLACSFFQSQTLNLALRHDWDPGTGWLRILQVLRPWWPSYFVIHEVTTDLSPHLLQVPFNAIQKNASQQVAATGAMLGATIPIGCGTAWIFAIKNHPFMELVTKRLMTEYNSWVWFNFVCFMYLDLNKHGLLSQQRNESDCFCRYILPYWTNTISTGVLYMWRTYLNYPCQDQVNTSTENAFFRPCFFCLKMVWPRTAVSFSIYWDAKEICFTKFRCEQFEFKSRSMEQLCLCILEWASVFDSLPVQCTDAHWFHPFWN